MDDVCHRDNFLHGVSKFVVIYKSDFVLVDEVWVHEEIVKVLMAGDCVDGYPSVRSLVISVLVYVHIQILNYAFLPDFVEHNDEGLCNVAAGRVFGVGRHSIDSLHFPFTGGEFFLYFDFSGDPVVTIRHSTKEDFVHIQILLLVECKLECRVESVMVACRKEMASSSDDMTYRFRSCAIVDLIWVDTVVIFFQVSSELFF